VTKFQLGHLLITISIVKSCIFHPSYTIGLLDYSWVKGPGWIGCCSDKEVAHEAAVARSETPWQYRVANEMKPCCEHSEANPYKIATLHSR